MKRQGGKHSDVAVVPPAAAVTVDASLLPPSIGKKGTHACNDDIVQDEAEFMVCGTTLQEESMREWDATR